MLPRARSITAGVMALPYLFKDKNDAVLPLGTPQHGKAEVQVSLDSCTGKVIATIPLGPAAGKTGVTRLSAPLPEVEGKHTLCLSVARSTVTPLWVLYDVQLNGTPAEARDR